MRHFLSFKDAYTYASAANKARVRIVTIYPYILTLLKNVINRYLALSSYRKTGKWPLVTSRLSISTVVFLIPSYECRICSIVPLSFSWDDIMLLTRITSHLPGQSLKFPQNSDTALPHWRQGPVNHCVTVNSFVTICITTFSHAFSYSRVFCQRFQNITDLELLLQPYIMSVLFRTQ